MDYLIDTHNHTAWEIDDGMPSKEDAIITLQNASKDGITEMIATPHFIPGTYTREYVDQIYQRIEDLKNLAAHFSIKVHIGGELFLNSGYLDMIDDKMCPTMAGSNYLLCEFDVRKDITNDEEADEKLYEIKIRNLTPVIAHVERYFHKKIDLNRVKEWIDAGYYIQVNRTSILGLHGEVCKENAEKLLEAGYVHIVASDTHRCSGSRTMLLSDVYKHILKKYGKEQADILCMRNPMHMIHNEKLETCAAVKKGFFSKLFGR